MYFSINKNVFEVYKTWTGSQNLKQERRRVMKAEDVDWDKNIPQSLVYYCCKILVKKFIETSSFEGIPHNNFGLILQLLPTDVPLTTTIPAVNDEQYWQRCAEERWHRNNDLVEYGMSWKRLYLERHLQEYLETLDPDTYSEEFLNHVVNLFGPYIRHLKLKELKNSKNYCKHINLETVLKGLPTLEVLDLVLGVKNIGMEFTSSAFKVFKKDAKNIGKGIMSHIYLKKLRIHRSSLKDKHVQCLVPFLMFISSLEKLDFSHCLITDEGAFALGYLFSHGNLRKLILTNNKIGFEGAQYLAHSLVISSSPLETLDLRLNPISDKGFQHICLAVLIKNIPQEIVVAGCGITNKSSKKLAQLLLYSKKLLRLDISNNAFGEASSKKLLVPVKKNKNIIKIDLRMTGASVETIKIINTQCEANMIARVRSQPDNEKLSLSDDMSFITSRRPTLFVNEEENIILPDQKNL